VVPSISEEIQHEMDCRRFLGDGYVYVHKWMDELFAALGPLHRKARHHREGIEDARRLFGADAAKAALIHVLRDCCNIPSAEDYKTGRVDALGFPLTMSVARVASFTDEELTKLVMQSLNEEHQCLLLMGWLEDPPQLIQMLQGVISDPQTQLQPLLEAWEKIRLRTPSLETSANAEQDGESRPFRLAEETYAPILGDKLTSLKEAIRSQFPDSAFGFIDAKELINPLQLIDLDYANYLQKGLPSQPNEMDAVLFAVPQQINVSVQATVDATSATIITRFQELALSAIEPQFLAEEGFVIRFKVSPFPQYILVGEHEGRYYLRAGMHRAFVLARAGVSEIPCVLVRNSGVPSITGPYPTYPAQVLSLARPPKLIDALDERFAVKTAFQPTRRLLRISAQDFAIPIL
jgi:hypothetical protein